MAVFKLNTYLRTRGFKNITPNFGMGKTNAEWVLPKKNLKVIRRLCNGHTQFDLYQSNVLIGQWTSEQKEEFKIILLQLLA